MLTKGISVKSITFRREGFKKFVETSMSRRYIKNCLFLVLFGSVVIAIYTVVMGTKRGVERSGWKGNVQNMRMHPDDLMLGNNRQEHLNENKGRPRIDLQHPHVQDEVPENNNDANLEENGNDNDVRENDNNAYVEENDNDADVRENDNDAYVEENNNDADVDDNGNDIDGNENNENAGIAANRPDEAIGNFNRERIPARMPAPRIPDLDPKDLHIRDKEGKFVGYKLFPHGIQPDHDLSPEQRLRNLRLRLGLPSVKKQEKEQYVEPEEPQIRKPKGIIHLDNNNIDNLGAFNLHNKIQNRLNPLPRQEIQDNKLNDKFRDIRNPQDQPNRLGGNFDQRARAGDDSFNSNNNALPGQLAQRNHVGDDINGALPYNHNQDPNYQQLAQKKPVILRPFGNNGMNPFHLDQKNPNGNFEPNNMNRFPSNDDSNELAKRKPVILRPLGNNGMNPFHLDPHNPNGNIVPHEVPNDEFQERKPFARRLDEDLLANAPPEPINQVHLGGRRLYENANTDSMPDRPVNENANTDSMPDRPVNTHFVNRGNNLATGLPHGNMEDVNSNRDRHNVFEPDMTGHETNEKHHIVEGGLIEKEGEHEQQTPLHIVNIEKPLPIDLDCPAFLFPPKQGILCVHDPAHDNALSGVIKTSGMWEPDMLAQFHIILKSDPGLGVVDIGAGIGIYAITAALMDRKVLAVEPLNLNYRLLHKSALENKVTSLITLVGQAVGSHTYTGRLKYDYATGGYSKTHVEKVSDEEANHDPSTVVQVTTLDNLVQALPFESAILKIDVGGSLDSDVLKMSSKFFKQLHVPYIMTHWNFPSGVTKIEIATTLSQMGYRPRLQWDGSDANPEILKGDIHFLVWAL